MGLQENRYFIWVEPALIIRKSTDDQRSYILYNHISNFNIKNDNFKLITMEVSHHKSNYADYKHEYRIEYVKYLKNLYPESYNTDGGFSAIINAIKSTNENLILLYKNYSLAGAASYSIVDKKKSIDIGHIGVIEKRKKYGTCILKEIFRTAKVLQYSITATSNGYADDFYHSMGMKRMIDKPLGIYTIQPKYIGEL